MSPYRVPADVPATTAPRWGATWWVRLVTIQTRWLRSGARLKNRQERERLKNKVMGCHRQMHEDNAFHFPISCSCRYHLTQTFPDGKTSTYLSPEGLAAANWA